MKKEMKDEIIYDSDKLINPAIDEAIGLKDNLYILRRMIYTTFKTRYKRSYLGIIWSMLNPLFTMIIFVIVFSFVFRFNVEHYALYVLSGNMIWAYFSQSTGESMMQMNSNAGLMRKIYLPKTIFIFSSVGINLINLLLTFIPFILVAIVDRLVIHWTIILVIPCMLIVTIFNVGISLVVGTVVPFLNDFSHIWNVFLTAWMYATPIFYPTSILDPGVFAVLKWNPIYIYLTIFREALLYHTVSAPELWISGTIMAIVAFMVGWRVFTKQSNEFAYRI